jgi:hypothetical protein
MVVVCLWIDTILSTNDFPLFASRLWLTTSAVAEFVIFADKAFLTGPPTSGFITDFLSQPTEAFVFTAHQLTGVASDTIPLQTKRLVHLFAIGVTLTTLLRRRFWFLTNIGNTNGLFPCLAIVILVAFFALVGNTDFFVTLFAILVCNTSNALEFFRTILLNANPFAGLTTQFFWFDSGTSEREER